MMFVLGGRRSALQSLNTLVLDEDLNVSCHITAVTQSETEKPVHLKVMK